MRLAVEDSEIRFPTILIAPCKEEGNDKREEGAFLFFLLFLFIVFFQIIPFTHSPFNVN